MNSVEPTQSIIVAMSLNGCIGKDNALPWHLRDDLQNFKRLTSHKPIIMGRKTHESIGRPLPNRFNIVVSRDKSFTANGCKLANSIEQALDEAKQWCQEQQCDELFVIGGAEIYAQCLPSSDRMYLTKVDVELQGDAWFPALDMDEWHETARQEFAQSEQNDFDFSVLELQRV